MSNLLGIHDAEGQAIAAPDSWILNLAALSERPQPPALDPRFHWITRLGWGYGTTGCLPLPAHYPAMAERAAQYVSRSSGCRRWIIGNESNLPREWPDHQPIYPWHYAAAYKLCRQAIHALPGHQYDDVLIAGSGPWNGELSYPGNERVDASGKKWGDWVKYFQDVIELCTPALDGFALHSYCHGYDPQLVISTARMDAPFEDRFYNFLCYRDYLDAIPTDLHHLPVYLTEANGDGPWQAVGLMPAMLDEIDKWNWGTNKPKISCVVFYRWPKYDHFYIEGRGDVIAEYNGVAAAGYESPAMDLPQRPPDLPEPPIEPEPTPPPPTADREIDPALAVRGVTFDFVSPPAGTWYWYCSKAEWMKDAAATVGPDHHILGNVLKQNVEAAGVSLRVDWPSGSATVTSKGDDPNASYNYDFAMTASLNEFSIFVDDGHPSDKVAGIGMGYGGNPAAHSSTWLTFEFVQVAEAEPMPPTVPPHTEYVIEPRGANLRTEPGEHGEILIAVPYKEAVTAYIEVWGDDGWKWQEVQYQQHHGWIRSDLISPKQPATIIPPAPIVPAPGRLVHPLPGSVITQHWGENWQNYVRWSMWGHNGTDFGGKLLGAPIVSMAAGVVAYVGYDDVGYGHFVEIKHDALLASTVYCHAQTINVQIGQPVAAGETIATLGSSGNSTGVHLHLETRLLNADGSYRDGTPMFKGRCDPETWAILHGLTL